MRNEANLEKMVLTVLEAHAASEQWMPLDKSMPMLLAIYRPRWYRRFSSRTVLTQHNGKEFQSGAAVKLLANTGAPSKHQRVY